jgi:extracellular factor (EF) 3-hydroxypalmitic acid methyl ester biosynthesis protein
MNYTTIKVKSKADEICEKFKADIIELTQRGPQTTDYPLLNLFFQEVYDAVQNGEITEHEKLQMREWFGVSFNTEQTLQGHVCVRPLGYNGDYLIIDKIYRMSLADDEVMKKWDLYYHQHPAPIAVRNRKDVFKQLLGSLEANSHILNLASGPSRDLYEFLQENKTPLQITNVDLDENAIAFSLDLLSQIDHPSNVQYVHANVLRFRTTDQFDLIWSAGLFDYFTDELFVKLLQKYAVNLAPNGTFVLGNFNTANVSRPYMEFADWNLNHRSKEQLIELGLEAGYSSARVFAEPTGINLFLELKK